MSGPSGDRLIRVDMTNQTVNIVPFPDEWKLLGGRALSAKILLAECDPECDPLGPDNVFVVAPGVLAGTAAPTSGRLSIGGKSPLTNGIKEANAGGNPGQDLMKLGYRGIVVTGKPADASKTYAIDVTADGATVVENAGAKMMWNYALIDYLAKSYSADASFISIGPAGELEMKGASVACTDQEARRPARHAARGGLGAVMGSKGLKYISIEAGKTTARKPADKKAFTALVKSYSKDYLAGPLMFKHGTSSITGVANMLNTFPYKNRTQGQSPDVETLDGKNIIESFETRGGGMHNCLTGCIVQCSNIVHDKDGNYKTSALEFETLTLLGSNCAIASWDDVADLDRLCDEVGLDTIETGAAIAIYMDAGKMEFGDAEGAKKLFDEIVANTEVGSAIGNGADATGALTKHHRVPTVRGQALPAWDPRPLKATGVTYASGPMGGDHTAGLIVNPGLPEEEWVRKSQEVQMVNAVCDSSGFCQFIQPNLDLIRKFYGALYGEEVSREAIADQAWQVLEDEWEFNRRAGWTRDDPMPQCIKDDPIGPANMVWDVSQDLIDQVYTRLDSSEELFTSAAAG
jgi:aldehyde:ferredoxin oxidoreductase